MLHCKCISNIIISWSIHKNWKVTQHANETGYHFDFENVEVVDKEKNYHQRLFLEAWFTINDKNAGNDCLQIADNYF